MTVIAMTRKINQMNQIKQRKIIYKQTLDDGLGKIIKIAVPIVAEFWKHNGKWEIVYPLAACRVIEAAIEKAYPGWHHTCWDPAEVKNTKELRDNCPACQRIKHKKEIDSKS